MLDFLVPFGLAHILLFIGLVFTAPSSFFLRLTIFAFIVPLCFLAVRSETALAIPGQAGGQYIYGMMMSCSHFMLLAKASALTHAQPGREWRWGWDMLCSARWGVSPKIIPSFRREDRSYVPSRREFLFSRAWDLVWTVTLIYLLANYKLYIYAWDFTMVPDGFLHRISEVSGREWIIRVYMTLVGKGEVYLTLKAGHSLVSLIGVGFGDSPARYPPLFGSIRETYRVRRFYVYFWHHLVRKVFTTHSSLVVNDILRIPRNTEFSRYLVLTGSFVMSAGMHVFIAPNIPLRCSIWPQLRYYLSIAMAIVLEDVLIISYNQAKKRLTSRKGTEKAILNELAEAKKASNPDTEKPAERVEEQGPPMDAIDVSTASGIETSSEANGSAVKRREVNPQEFLAEENQTLEIKTSSESDGSEVNPQVPRAEESEASGIEASLQANGIALKRHEASPQEPKAEESISTVPVVAQSTATSDSLFKLFGYIWVFAFEVWSTSKFLYLTQQCQMELNASPFLWDEDIDY